MPLATPGDLAVLVAVVVLAVVGYVARVFLSGMRAERRAEAVVRDLLTADEFSLLRQQGFLDVLSSGTPGRVYRIPARPGTVTVMDGNEVTMRMCLVPGEAIPATEWVVVHKLLLEAAEDDYLQLANHLRYGLPVAGETQVEVWTTTPPGVLGHR